jgi:hypothetical protein
MLKEAEATVKHWGNPQGQEDIIGKNDNIEAGQSKKSSGVLNVIISGLALFSDGYNAQISEYRRNMGQVLY